MRVYVCMLMSACIVGGCGSSEESSSAQPMMFDVVDSLLGKECMIAESGIRFSLPVGFAIAEDSIMDMLRDEIARHMGGDKRIKTIACYIDTANRAGILIANLDGVDVRSDTGDFVDRYRNSLQDIFGESQVREGSYLVNGVYVRNFLVSHGGMIRFQLLCQADSTGAAELVYLASQATYPYLIKRFESSMGTLSRLKQEDSQ